MFAKASTGTKIPRVGEAEINDLLLELIDAWNRGAGDAYEVLFCNDATSTDVNEMLHVGREEFSQRHNEIFRGVLKVAKFH